MRWFMLATLLAVASVSPALAGKPSVTRAPTHRTTYPMGAGSPVKYAGHTHVAAAVAGHGCTTCAAEPSCTSCASKPSCSSGCGCRPKKCCSPLGDLVDNVADLFVSLKPCPGPCSPCVRKVHSCNYPRTCPPSNCCEPRLPTLLDTIFFCNKKCHKPCGGGCATGGCTSGCTSGAAPGGVIHEELVPPSPPPMMRETPFQDDPVEKESRARTRTQTTHTHKPYYKVSRPAPIVAKRAPETIVVGNALPIGMRE